MSDTEEQQKQLLSAAVQLLHDQYEGNLAFNEFFDGGDPVAVPSAREGVEPYQYERSRVLFWLDREAYEDERTAWENDTNQAKHQEIIEVIRSHGLVAPFHDLLNAVERNRIVPFIGAGMSKGMGMPLWSEALRQLLRRLPGADGPAIGALIDSGDYLAAAQMLVEHDFVQVANFIRTTYGVERLRLVGPMRLLPNFATGCVVTTNFDDAIEQVYRDKNVEFSAYMHGTQQHNFFSRLVRGDRCLLKLHGDVENSDTHILTQAQYADAYGEPFDFHKPLPKALRQIFVSQSLLFLGCSLEQDWTLALFRMAMEEDGYEIPRHYAVLPVPADARLRQQKESRLLSVNIQPLWYPEGEHEFVEKYLQFLVDVAERRIAFGG